MSLNIHIAAATDRGQVRTQNQDFHAYQVPHQGCLHPKGILLAVDMPAASRHPASPWIR